VRDAAYRPGGGFFMIDNRALSDPARASFLTARLRSVDSGKTVRIGHSYAAVSSYEFFTGKTEFFPGKSINPAGLVKAGE
jgi:hypothetical protein